ncbi:NADH-quinone oxidoreductase subunit N [Gemmatimonadetes bacterium T265]|nr:NADH-quinone oxidoreductase subunit N [Gemmatimonadetes bacterium T265]
MTGFSSAALLPDLVVAVGALLLLLWSAARRDDDVDAARGAALGVVGVCATALVAVVLLATGRVEPGTVPGIATDGFRWGIDVVILVGTALTALLAGDDARATRVSQTESFALMLLSASGMMLLGAGRDLILIFLGIELMSIPQYVLAAINRRSARSAEAGLKYFLLGAFSTAFLLYGVALVYGATGATDLDAIAAAIAGPPIALPPVVLALGVGAVLVGLGFKVAAVPFHMWTPDVYEGAPTPYTAFMAAAVKAGGFAALARVMLVGMGGAVERWHAVLWWIAVLTMFGGNLVALAQKSVKRMLAYSSIAHAGYLLVAVVSNSALGSSALVFYLAAYTLATVGGFAVVQALGGTPQGDALDRWNGLFRVKPHLAVAMAVFMLALLGFPIAGGMGFFAKWYVLQAALAPLAPQAPQSRLAVLLVLASVISAGYYLNVVARMFMRAPDSDAPPAAATATWTKLVIAGCVVVLLVLGVYPTPAVHAAQAAALRPASSAADVRRALAPAPASPSGVPAGVPAVATVP